MIYELWDQNYVDELAMLRKKNLKYLVYIMNIPYVKAMIIINHNCRIKYWSEEWAKKSYNEE